MCLVIAFLLCFFGGCTATHNEAIDNGRVNIVTTVFPMYDFVRAVGGERVSVEMLIDPGCEVHSFDPTPSDVAAIYNADLFIYVGGESEKWVDRILADINVSTLVMMGQVARLTEEHDHNHHEHDHTHESDEHIWTSPENAVSMLDAVGKALSSIDPDNADYYASNLADYCDKVRDVQTELHDVVRESEDKFILVADRFPFIYFAEEFGLEYKAAFGGCAVSNDISIKVMGELIKTVEQRKCTAAFYTEMSNRNIALALAEQTGVELLELHSAHNVTAEDFNNGVTYVDIMKRNIISLRRGLR